MTPTDLKTYRFSTGRNLRQFGEYLGVTGAAVSQWELGHTPIPKWLVKLINALQKIELLEKPHPKKPGVIKHSEGYVLILNKSHPRANNKGYVPEHILICEKVLGKPLPIDALPHHVDGKRDNNQNTNLVICQDLDYHNLLHRRERALKECGHASWRKCCYCHKYDSLAELVERKGSRYSVSYHKRCHAEYARMHKKTGMTYREYRTYLKGHNSLFKTRSTP